MLERFDDPEIAHMIAELREASSAIDDARRTVAQGDAAARRAAIERLGKRQPANLYGGTLRELRTTDAQWSESERRADEDHVAAEARRQEQERRERERTNDAERIAREARTAFDGGDTAAAFAAIEAFQPPHEILTELREELRATIRVPELAATAKEALAIGDLARARRALDEADALRRPDEALKDVRASVEAAEHARRKRRRRLLQQVGTAGAIALSVIYWTYQV